MNIYIARYSSNLVEELVESRAEIAARGIGFLIEAEDRAEACAIADVFVGIEVKTGEQLAKLVSVERATPVERVRTPWIGYCGPFLLAQLARVHGATLQ